MSSLRTLALAPVGILLLVQASSAMHLKYNESTICEKGNLCENPNLQYQRVLPGQPGYQWDDAGGYCGSWAIQRATLIKGAWISQQQVRDHTSPGGGHDNEILSTNIEEAFKNLKISFEAFDYNQPRPQQAAYGKWLKKQLAAGYPVTWMIMWSGERFPIYDLTPPAGMYGHVEPVIGIQSSHPLNDTTVYDDDTVLHFTDGGLNTVHRRISTLGGKWNGPGTAANCGWYSYCMASYAFGWAVKGFTDSHPAMPASLQVDPWQSEPDTRSGDAPESLKGTLTMTELEEGSTYDIYRWDTVSDAFTYDDSFKKASFKATNDTYIYADDVPIASNGTTYYRCVSQE